MVPTQQYKKFLTELVRKHMVIFGVNIAREIAISVPGLKVDESGEVMEIRGSAMAAIKKITSRFQELSEPVALLQFRLIMDKYPDIFLEYNEPLPSVSLSCALIDHKLWP